MCLSSNVSAALANVSARQPRGPPGPPLPRALCLAAAPLSSSGPSPLRSSLHLAHRSSLPLPLPLSTPPTLAAPPSSSRSPPTPALVAAPSSRPSDSPRPSRSTPRVDGSASPRAAPMRGAPPSPSPSPCSPRDHMPLLRRDARVLLCCKPLLTRRMCRAKCRRF